MKQARNRMRPRTMCHIHCIADWYLYKGSMQSKVGLRFEAPIQRHMRPSGTGKEWFYGIQWWYKGRALCHMASLVGIGVKHQSHVPRGHGAPSYFILYFLYEGWIWSIFNGKNISHVSSTNQKIAHTNNVRLNRQVVDLDVWYISALHVFLPRDLSVTSNSQVHHLK